MSEPNKIERTSRRVIEGKLLEALGRGGTVAILVSEEELDYYIAAFESALLFSTNGQVPDKWREIQAGLEQLRTEAFHK